MKCALTVVLTFSLTIPALGTDALPPLRLPCGEVQLETAELPAFRERLAAEAEGAAAVWVLQYDVETTRSSAVRAAVSESGAELLDPVSGGAYLVRGTPAQALAVIDAAGVAAAREYRLEDKLVEGMQTEAVVSLFSGADEARARKTFAAIPGCEVLGGGDGTLRVRATAPALAAVAADSDVQAVGPWQEPVLTPGTHDR